MANQQIERGLAAIAEGKYEIACEQFRTAASQNPKLIAAHVNLGSVLWMMQDADAAKAAFLVAIEIEPRSADAHMNLGVICGEANQYAEAVRHLRMAIAIAPTAGSYSNLGVVHRRQNKRVLALRAFEAAVALDPDDWEHHWNCASEYLVLGRYAEGWQEYRHRPIASLFEIGKDSRVWQGDVVGHLVIHYEQGFGDTFQTTRYIDAASKKCDRLAFVVQPELVELMRLSFVHNAKVAVTTTVPADYDCYQFAGSLMIGAGIDAIPTTPYLAVPSSPKWRHLHSFPGLRVGLVWAGRDDTQYDIRRSMDLEDFAPLLSLPGVKFVSLQVGRCAYDNRVYDVGPYLRDWAMTAAAINELDLIISVDTAVAHLAGAMGKPVWLLNRFDTCWRWQLDRSDTPWYPSMRIFRQPSAGDWLTVMTEVVTALDDFIISARSGGLSVQ